MLIPILLVAAVVVGVGIAVASAAGVGVVRLRTAEEVEATHERTIGKPAVIALTRGFDAARVQTILEEYAKAEANKDIKFFLATIELAIEMGPFESPLANMGVASGIVGDGAAFEEWSQGERAMEAIPAKKAAMRVMIEKAVAAARTPKPADPTAGRHYLFVMPRVVKAKGVQIGGPKHWGPSGPGGRTAGRR